jgi:hypothetical protein
MLSSEQIDSEILIPIYKEIKNGVYQCAEESLPYSNLMGLVFHEAMYFNSCFVYEKIWYNREINIEYPFLGYRKNKFSSEINHYVSKKRKFASTLSNLVNNNKFTIGLLNPSINFFELSKMLFREKINFCFPKSSSIKISNFSNQIQIIEDIFSRIWKNYELGDKYLQFIKAIKSYNEITSKHDEINSYDLLITGSPVKIPIRAEAAYALSKNIPTICVDHGNETGTADHPSWGYDEQSYSSHFIGYGRAGVKAVNDGDYLKSLYNNNPKYIESNCSFIKNTYANSSVMELNNEISKLKIAYIPTKLMGSKRLGPFLSISDEDYLKWQRYLFNSFNNLEYKAHPKQNIIVNIENIKIVRDPIEDCIDNYECFFTDNVLSTAFANIAATNKPIIYFNIGFGNLTITAETAIRERVIWIDIDINNPDNLMERIQKQKSKKCTNNYTELFCLSDRSDSRELTVLKTIKKIMN